MRNRSNSHSSVSGHHDTRRSHEIPPDLPPPLPHARIFPRVYCVRSHSHRSFSASRRRIWYKTPALRHEDEQQTVLHGILYRRGSWCFPSCLGYSHDHTLHTHCCLQSSSFLFLLALPSLQNAAMVLSYPALAGEGVMDRGQRAKARRYRISITPLPTLDVPFFFFLV
jgi:hypothetical protein